LAGEIYDYIAGLIAVGMIFVSAVMVIPNMSYVNVLCVDQQQLRNTALETLKAMLLEPGYPADWGMRDPFDQDEVRRFGLAYPDSPSFHVLDPNKVQRLVEENPMGYIEYGKVRELLGLEGYGFSLSILPPFNVTWTKNSEDDENLNFTIKTLQNDGKPIRPKANVDTTIVYTTKKGNTAMLYLDFVNGISTNPLGECTITKTLSVPPGEELQDVIVVFRVSVADVAAVMATYQKCQSEEFAEIAEINIVGENVTLTIPPEAQPRDARWVDGMIVVSGSKVMFLHNGTRSNDDKLTWGQGYKVWERRFKGLESYNPVLIIGGIWAVAEGEGRAELLAMGPYPNLLGSRVLKYGDAPGARSATSIVKLQRAVVISGMTYIAEITLWKEFQ